MTPLFSTFIPHVQCFSKRNHLTLTFLLRDMEVSFGLLKETLSEILNRPVGHVPQGFTYCSSVALSCQSCSYTAPFSNGRTRTNITIPFTVTLFPRQTDRLQSNYPSLFYQSSSLTYTNPKASEFLLKRLWAAHGHLIMSRSRKQVIISLSNINYSRNVLIKQSV